MSDGSENSFPPPPEGFRRWGDFCAAFPDDPICEGVPSYFEYRPSIAANATFVALFGISLISFIVTFAVTRRAKGFTFAFTAGVILEVLGYAGRLMSSQNRWSQDGFMMQICCLTIAPAFLAGGVYLCLRRIVAAFGAENSRLKPEMYTRFFIPCDVISLILQAAGGAMASISSQNAEGGYDRTGDHIMMAGLAFQVFTLLVFMICSVDFGLNVWRRHKRLGDAAFDQSEAVRAVRGSFLFKGCVGALAVATVCIFWRSVFRVAELSEGWSGPLMARQDLFIGFEGVMIVVACFVLNVFHPSVCFKGLMTGPGGVQLGRRKKVAAGSPEKSEQTSDADGTV